MKHRFHVILLAGLLLAFGIGGSLAGILPCEEALARPAQRHLKVSLKALQQIQFLREEKALRTPAQRKIDSQLIYKLKIMRGDAIIGSVPMLRSSVEIASDGTTLVDLRAKVSASLLAEIERLGGSIVSSYEQYDAIRARLPLEQMERLAEQADITFIGPAARAMNNKINTSEGDVAHQAALARSTFGVDGTKVKIGVLSDSVDHLAEVQASGDLPAVTVLQDAPGNTGEGTAMLEIIHDLAPGAALYFATAWLGPASFADNILALRNAGCHIIVDDVTYFNESPFQDDVISQAVNTVTGNGALYFSSAGNGGNLNDGTSSAWEGDFSGMADVSLPAPLNALVVHDFDGGDATNAIIGSDPRSFYRLFWSDPLGDSGNDYDLYALQPDGNIAAVSDNVQDGNDDPLEGLNGTGNLAGFQFVVAQFSGVDRFLHFNSFGTSILEHTTAGQIKGHPAAADAFAVAAVEAAGMTTAFDGTESVEVFSSDGPRRVFYDENGDPITPGDFSSTGGGVRQKPDMAAADGVATATPFFNPFYGTSAAAPHAAAVAALLHSAELSLTPEFLREALMASALDIEAAGWDRDSGAGIVMSDVAISYVGILVRPFQALRSSGPPDGPFSPSSKAYTLTNVADGPIDWEASKEQGQAWVALSTMSGTLGVGESTIVTVTINDNARTLGEGSYSETIHFANATSGDEIATRAVSLRVRQRGVNPGTYLLLM